MLFTNITLLCSFLQLFTISHNMESTEVSVSSLTEKKIWNTVECCSAISNNMSFVKSG